MINNENLINLYELILSNNELTTKDYQYIIDMLEEKSNLSLIESYLLKLCYTYIEIEKNSVIPVTNLDKTQNLFVAIDRNNFKLALKLTKEKFDSTNPLIKILDIILNDIINGIIKQNIFINLEKQNLDEAFKLLKQYLIKINKIKYEKNIINIIKLCIVKNDISFIKLREFLCQLENNNIIEYYIDKFYDLLNEKDFNQAQVYLDIINNLDIDNKLIESLTKELNQSEIKNEKKQKNNKNITNNPYYQFLFDISKKIETEKLILINDMDKIQNIEKYIKYFPNIRSFRIEHNGGIVIALKFYQKRNEDFKKLIKDGTRFFNEGKYEKTIDCFELLKSLSNKNISQNYIQLGWAYFHIGRLRKALKYFIVADYLSKKEGKKYRFSGIIERLSEPLEKNEDSKPYFEMDIEELKNEFDDNYDILFLSEIIDLINTSSISIDEACLKFNLDEININIIKLIIARDCYTNEDYVIGDKLLKIVERSNYKNKKILDLLNEIRKNKLFYKNREDKQVLIINHKVLKY